MFRSIPVSNKICFDKQIKRNWKIHQKKLFQIKSKLSQQRSQQFIFLQQSNKHNVLKDIKNRQVQRSNHILFKKIQQIQRKGPKNSLTKLRDQNNHGKLLHQPARKRQMIKIFEQNQDLLKRIQDKKSAYNVKKMQRQRRSIERNISLISQFQYKNYPETHTKVNLYVKQDDQFRYQSQKLNQSLGKNQNQPRCKTMGKFRYKSLNRLFHQCTKIINEQNYVITTYTNKNKFYVEVENQQNHFDKYRMEMTQKQVNKLLQTYYNNQINYLVDSLQIDPQTMSCYLKFQKQPHSTETLRHSQTKENSSS